MSKTTRMMAETLNREYPKIFDAAFEERFGEKCKTAFNLFVGVAGELVTVRENGRAMQPKHRTWARAFSDGFFAATVRVREETSI